MWTEEQIEAVAELLKTFNGADEVCAVTGCSPEDLDDYSTQAFKCNFEQARAVFAAQGRASVRKVLMHKAVDEGDMRAIDMVARAYLGIDPVQNRKAIEQDTTQGVTDEKETVLAIIQRKRLMRGSVQETDEENERETTGYHGNRTHRQQRDPADTLKRRRETADTEEQAKENYA